MPCFFQRKKCEAAFTLAVAELEHFAKSIDTKWLSALAVNVT